jgi:hypothetical protein
MVAMAELKGVLPEAHVHVDVTATPPAPVAEEKITAATEDPGKKVYGLLAEFDDPEQLLRAAHMVREANYTRWDAHSPFPVHGLERVMGLRKSKVPWLVLIMGLSGAAAGMLLQWVVSSIVYPLIISGKPLFSWPAFVPIMFECGVLGGGLGALLGFLLFTRLPEHYHPLFNSKRFERMTDDKFFLSIEAKDPKFQNERTEQLLLSTGAANVEFITV